MNKSLILVVVTAFLGWYFYNKSLDNEMADMYIHCQEKTRKMTGDTSFDNSGNCDCMVQSMRKERSILNDYILKKQRKKEKHHYLVCSKDVVIYSTIKKLKEVSDAPEDIKHYSCIANVFYKKELQDESVDDVDTLKECNFLN